MKLNKKGMTLLEIIVSISLISLVLIFLFQLLIQVNNQNADNEVRASYLINQSSFIKQIEEDIMNFPSFVDDVTFSECTTSDIKDEVNHLYLPNIYQNDYIFSGKNTNIKCIKFGYDKYSVGYDIRWYYLFLYKKRKDEGYETVLGYYGDYKQTEVLEDFDWDINFDNAENPLNIIIKEEENMKIASLPIIGPDYKDYSINISYLKE